MWTERPSSVSVLLVHNEDRLSAAGPQAPRRDRRLREEEQGCAARPGKIWFHRPDRVFGVAALLHAAQDVSSCSELLILSISIKV